MADKITLDPSDFEEKQGEVTLDASDFEEEPKEGLGKKALEFARSASIGAGKGMINTADSIAKLFGVPPASSFPGYGYETENVRMPTVANISEFVVPALFPYGRAAEGLGLAQKALVPSEYFLNQAVQRGAGLLEKGAKNIPLGAAAGMLQEAATTEGGATPGQLSTGAGVGAGLGMAMPFAKPAMQIIGKGISKVTAPLKPKALGENILKDLSGGQRLSENAQSLAAETKQSFENLSSMGSELYAPIDAAAKGAKVNANELGKIVADNKGVIKPGYEKAIGLNNKIETMFNDYMSNQTYENAQALQSQLGSRIRDMTAANAKKQLSQHDVDLMERYGDIRQAVKSDIKRTLGEIDEQLPAAYDKATNFWDTRVSIYKENPKILAMVRGKVTDPRNIIDIFKNPEADIKQIVSDLGQRGTNRILFAELGKYDTPEGVLKAANELDKKGLSYYENEEITNQIKDLAKKIKTRQRLRTIGTLGLGAAGVEGGYHLLKNIVTGQ